MNEAGTDGAKETAEEARVLVEEDYYRQEEWRLEATERRQL